MDNHRSVTIGVCIGLVVLLLGAMAIVNNNDPIPKRTDRRPGDGDPACLDGVGAVGIDAAAAFQAPE